MAYLKLLCGIRIDGGKDGLVIWQARCSNLLSMEGKYLSLNVSDRTGRNWFAHLIFWECVDLAL